MKITHSEIPYLFVLKQKVKKDFLIIDYDFVILENYSKNQDSYQIR